MLKNNNNNVLLLQSGGRDSALAAINLLDKGVNVLAVTFSVDAKLNIEAPRKRAIEISKKSKNYDWYMVDFTNWENDFKKHVSDSIDIELPKSCLLCALSKITATMYIGKKIGCHSIALGYVDYQNDWSEQTPYAISLQKEALDKRGFELLLPACDTSSKGEAENSLIVAGLSSNSLENPCCISKWGTHDVSDELIKQSILFAFEYFDEHKPKIEIVEHIGRNNLCL